MTEDICPCRADAQDKLAFSACCGPYLAREKYPPTAEALMRSRYSAFATADIDYLFETLAEDQRHDFDRAATSDWAKKSEWLGLAIVATEGGATSDSTGVVTFTGTGNASRILTKVSSVAGLAAGMPVFASDGSAPPGTTITGTSPSSVQLSAPTTSKAADLTFTAGLQVVQALSASVTQTLVYGTDFTVDAKKGWLIRLNAWTGQKQRWEAVPTTVQYLGGYQTIPDDLVDACLRLVTMRFASRGRDPMLVERSQNNLVGTERYWVGPVHGQSSSLPPEIALLVDHYRTPVIA